MSVIVKVLDLNETHREDLENLLFQLSGKERTINFKIHPNTYSVAALDGSKLIGFAQLFILHKTTFTLGHLEDVIVDQSYRGQGIGQKIINEVVLIAQNEGVSHINLTVRPKRESAQKLYESIGFKRQTTNVFRLELK